MSSLADRVKSGVRKAVKPVSDEWRWFEGLMRKDLRRAGIDPGNLEGSKLTDLWMGHGAGGFIQKSGGFGGFRDSGHCVSVNSEDPSKTESVAAHVCNVMEHRISGEPTQKRTALSVEDEIESALEETLEALKALQAMARDPSQQGRVRSQAAKLEAAIGAALSRLAKLEKRPGQRVAELEQGLRDLQKNIRGLKQKKTKKQLETLQKNLEEYRRLQRLKKIKEELGRTPKW
jgi:hypothetical protein